jgi:hypothetical protein
LEHNQKRTVSTNQCKRETGVCSALFESGSMAENILMSNNKFATRTVNKNV